MAACTGPIKEVMYGFNRCKKIKIQNVNNARVNMHLEEEAQKNLASCNIKCRNLDDIGTN